MKKILFFIGITFFSLYFFSVLWDYNMIEEFLYSICTGFTGFLPDAMESLKEEEFKEKVLPLVLGLGLFLVVVVMIEIFIRIICNDCRKIDSKEEN